MLSKEEFINYIDKIQESFNRSDRICKGLEELVDGSLVMTFNEPLIGMIIDLLEHIFYDTEEWIQYFMWELDFGSDFEMGNVIIDNGKIEVDMSTSDKLYDFLIYNMDQPKSEVDKSSKINPSDIFDNSDIFSEVFNKD